jgi:hypothetical protein
VLDACDGQFLKKLISVLMTMKRLQRILPSCLIAAVLAVTFDIQYAAGQAELEGCAGNLPDISDDADAQTIASALDGHYQTKFNKPPTPQLQRQKALFFKCVALSADAGMKDVQDRRNVALGFLNFLGTRPDWNAAEPEPKEKLIAGGRELKAAETPDADLIRALDAALFQSANDISAALRPITEDYAAFVAKKRQTLEQAVISGRYGNGPYEIYVDELLALALEESYFQSVSKTGATGDEELLVRAAESYSRALARLDNPGIFETERQRKFSRNDILFRRALYFILLGRIDEARSDLQQIIKSGRTWEQETLMDHVFVEKFFRLPVRIELVRRESGGVELVIKDENLIKRFFNPAQIALYLCGRLPAEATEPLSYQDIDRHLRDFTNHDYRVYLASSKDIARLKAIQSDLQNRLNALNEDETANIYAALDSNEPAKFETVFIDGKENCFSPNEDAPPDREVFQTLELTVRGTWQDGEREGKTYGVYVGGYLSYPQAVRLSELLVKHLGLKQKPFAARPKIEG